MISDKDLKELQKIVLESLARAEELAKPVCLDYLEREGILTKAGAWYRIRNIHELPVEVRNRITEIEDDSKGRATRVKISKGRLSSKHVEKLRSFARKLGAVAEPKESDEQRH